MTQVGIDSKMRRSTAGGIWTLVVERIILQDRRELGPERLGDDLEIVEDLIVGPDVR